MSAPLVDLAEVEQRVNAATPGPWWNDGHEIYVGEDGIPAASTWIGETCSVELPDYGDANGTFIAHARQDVPALVAEVRRLKARVEELERATPAETALCSCWIKEHGSPERWSESVRREYANVIADLRLEVAR